MISVLMGNPLDCYLCGWTHFYYAKFIRNAQTRNCVF